MEERNSFQHSMVLIRREGKGDSNSEEEQQKEV